MSRHRKCFLMNSENKTYLHRYPIPIRVYRIPIRVHRIPIRVGTCI